VKATGNAAGEPGKAEPNVVPTGPGIGELSWCCGEYIEKIEKMVPALKEWALTERTQAYVSHFHSLLRDAGQVLPLDAMTERTQAYASHFDSLLRDAGFPLDAMTARTQAYLSHFDSLLRDAGLLPLDAWSSLVLAYVYIVVLAICLILRGSLAARKNCDARQGPVVASKEPGQTQCQPKRVKLGAAQSSGKSQGDGPVSLLVSDEDSKEQGAQKVLPLPLPLPAGEGVAVEKQGLEALRTEDVDGVWDGNVHDHEEDKDWTGNFVVLGTTGSGKTTLIRYAPSRSESPSPHYMYEIVVLTCQITHCSCLQVHDH
jgi:hypothetical protein